MIFCGFLMNREFPMNAGFKQCSTFNKDEAKTRKFSLNPAVNHNNFFCGLQYIASD